MRLAKRPLFASMAGVLAAVGARRAGLGFAAACLAGAAYADEIPPAAPGSAAPASGQPAPARDGAEARRRRP